LPKVRVLRRLKRSAAAWYSPSMAVRRKIRRDKRSRAKVTRTPPKAVLSGLRREVGFGCPVDDCGVPFLTWHHFDPPWSKERHHRPGGMIALCSVHHAAADQGAFTVEQLRAMKLRYLETGQLVQSRLQWMRRDLLLFVGGTLYYRTPVIFRWDLHDVISLNRDGDGMLTLNAEMLTISGKSRLHIRDNFFRVRSGDDLDLECAPSGHRLSAKYENGDYLSVRFREVKDAAECVKRYGSEPTAFGAVFPIVVVEVANTIGGTGIRFSATETTIGTNAISGSMVVSCSAGIVLSGGLSARALAT
jgi:hypothetical protein